MTTPLCSVCGHGVYYHVKGGVLDPQACIVGGINCASHTYATSVSASLSPLLSKLNFQAEPILYVSCDNVVTDAGGLNNDGTWSAGEAYETGVNGDANGAATLAGTNDITIATEGEFDFDITDAFSISVWIKNADAVENVIIGKRNTLTSVGWNLTQVVTSGLVMFQIDDTAEFDVTSTTDVTDDAWHHVVATFDGSSNQSGMNIYIDGVLETTGVASAMSGDMTNAIAVTIGATGDASGDYEGAVDNVAVWDGELNQAAVTALYNSGTMVALLA